MTQVSQPICVFIHPIALKSCRRPGSTAAEMSLKFQSDTHIQTTNCTALKLLKRPYDTTSSQPATHKNNTPWTCDSMPPIVITPHLPRAHRKGVVPQVSQNARLAVSCPRSSSAHQSGATRPVWQPTLQQHHRIHYTPLTTTLPPPTRCSIITMTTTPVLQAGLLVASLYVQ